MSAILPNWVSRQVEKYSVDVAHFLGFQGDTGNRHEILRYLQQPDGKRLFYDVYNTYAGLLNRVRMDNV